MCNPRHVWMIIHVVCTKPTTGNVPVKNNNNPKASVSRRECWHVIVRACVWRAWCNKRNYESNSIKKEYRGLECVQKLNLNPPLNLNQSLIGSYQNKWCEITQTSFMYTVDCLSYVPPRWYCFFDSLIIIYKEVFIILWWGFFSSIWRVFNGQKNL